MIDEFKVNNIDYKIVGEGRVFIANIEKGEENLVVPSEVFSPEGLRYSVIGIEMPIISIGIFKQVSFDASSLIEVVPASFTNLTRTKNLTEMVS